MPCKVTFKYYDMTTDLCEPLRGSCINYLLFVLIQSCTCSDLLPLVSFYFHLLSCDSKAMCHPYSGLPHTSFLNFLLGRTEHHPATFWQGKGSAVVFQYRLLSLIVAKLLLKHNYIKRWNVIWDENIFLLLLLSMKIFTKPILFHKKRTRQSAGRSKSLRTLMRNNLPIIGFVLFWLDDI